MKNHALRNNSWYTVLTLNNERVKVHYIHNKENNTEQLISEDGNVLYNYDEDVDLFLKVAATAKVIYDYYYSYTVAKRFSEMWHFNFSLEYRNTIQEKYYVDCTEHKSPSFFKNENDIVFVCSTDEIPVCTKILW